MKINFKRLDENKKIIQFLEGIFSLEKDNKFSWIWTAKRVSGVINNINTITIKAFSEIDNILICDNNEMEIRSDSLNIIKLNLFEKKDFSFELSNGFYPVNDDRELGIRIIGILADEEVIF